MPVGEMLSRISSRELTEWGIYFRLEQEERDKLELERRVQEGLRTAKARPRKAV